MSWGLGYEEPLCTSGFFGYRSPLWLTLAKKGTYRKETVASNRKFSEPSLLKIPIRNKWWYVMFLRSHT